MSLSIANMQRVLYFIFSLFSLRTVSSGWYMLMLDFRSQGQSFKPQVSAIILFPYTRTLLHLMILSVSTQVYKWVLINSYWMDKYLIQCGGSNTTSYFIIVLWLYGLCQLVAHSLFFYSL